VARQGCHSELIRRGCAKKLKPEIKLTLFVEILRTAEGAALRMTPELFIFANTKNESLWEIQARVLRIFGVMILLHYHR